MFYRLILLAVAMATTASTANAAAIVLWPVDPTIAPGERATALWIENKGKDPVTLQVRSLGWHQHGSEDQYVDQDEVVASPPMPPFPQASGSWSASYAGRPALSRPNKAIGF